MALDTNSKSLYDVFDVPKDASIADIRKAYRKLALQMHPDKNQDDPTANERFQTLQKMYNTLSDPDKRALYDDTGSWEGSEKQDIDEDLLNYFRGFRQVSEEDIERTTSEYRGSDEERRDLLKLYTSYSGNMSSVFDYLICSDEKLDSHRFMEAIEAAIAEGEVEPTRAFTAWAKKVAKLPRPSDPLARKAPAPPNDALVAAVRGRGAASRMTDLAAELEAKYGGGTKAKGGKRRTRAPAPEEPTEEEFAAIQARVLKKPAPAEAGEGTKRSKKAAAAATATPTRKSGRKQRE